MGTAAQLALQWQLGLDLAQQTPIVLLVRRQLVPQELTVVVLVQPQPVSASAVHPVRSVLVMQQASYPVQQVAIVLVELSALQIPTPPLRCARLATIAQLGAHFHSSAALVRPTAVPVLLRVLRAL